MSEEIGNNGKPDNEETEELSVYLTEDDLVALEGADWQLCLLPDEARLLAQLLVETADEAGKEPGPGLASD